MSTPRIAGLPVVGLVLLAAWLGAAVLTAAVVAPAAFAVLPSRTLAGAVVGRVLPTIFWSGMVVGVLAALSARGLDRARWHGVALALLVAACAAAQIGVAPRIARIRLAAGGGIDLLDPADPRRVAFGRLHAMSVGWMGLAAVAALVALVFIARSILTRSDGVRRHSLTTSALHG